MAVPGDFGCFYIVVPACEEVRPFFISILRQRLLGARPDPWQQDVVQRRLRCECRSNGWRLEQQPGHPQHQPFRTHNHKKEKVCLKLRVYFRQRDTTCCESKMAGGLLSFLNNESGLLVAEVPVVFSVDLSSLFYHR